MSDYAQNINLAEFFKWKHHPFIDNQSIKDYWINENEMRIIELGKTFISQGLSFVIYGNTGLGKSVLTKMILSHLDKNYYSQHYLPYNRYRSYAFIQTLANTFNVDIKGKDLPSLLKIQKHIISLKNGNNQIFPVLVIDDAQQLEQSSFFDLASLMTNPITGNACTSIIFVGNPVLKTLLNFNILESVNSRMTTFFELKALEKNEISDYIKHRIKISGAPADLFDTEAINLIGIISKGIRREIMKICSILLLEGCIRREKTIGVEIIHTSKMLKISEQS